MKKRILVSPTSFAKFDRRPLELLAEYEVILNPHGRKMTPEEVVASGEGAVGIVAGVETLNRWVFERMPGLKCISRVGVGIDSIDLEAAKEFGIAVRNTPSGPTLSVAELTVGVILALLRDICGANRNMHDGIWKKAYGSLLSGKRVGIIGLGTIGRAVAERLNVFGCRLAGYDPRPDMEWLTRSGVALVPFGELLATSDIVCLHLSFSRENRHLIGAQELTAMKKGACLVNMSRGGIVDESALLEALRAGHLAGAAIDVFEEEPYHGPLQKLDNVILTPHIGSYAREGRVQMEIDAVRNLLEELE